MIVAILYEEVVEYQCVRFIYYRDIILFYHDCHLIIMCQIYSTRYKKCFAERV